jgi:BirA family biotin operon repressor/biotin-[acetyl-CoA-carboxylase] ligase
MVVSLALIYFLEKMGFAAHIKWPNDIYMGGAKAGGILIENQLRGNQFRFSVIGVGLNVNQLSFGNKWATSLQLLSGREYHLNTCLESLLNCLDEQIARLKEGKGVVEEEYHSYLFRMGEASSFRSVIDDVTFVGTIKGVNEQGQLLLFTETGLRSFGLKEVEFVL